MRIKFKKGFSSPELGNVWIGRTLEVHGKQAQRFIELGFAVLIEEEKGALLGKHRKSNRGKKSP
jgi:hypothetical protein